MKVTVIAFTTQTALGAGLRAMLLGVEGLYLGGVESDPWKFRDVLRRETPNVLLLDRESGIELDALLDLRREFPNASIVLWTKDISPEFATRAVELGVRGILDKTLSEDLHVKCLRKVADGEMWLGKMLTESILSQRAVNLSPRERQLVAALNIGLSNKEIAACLSISEGSVKVYLSRLYKRVGVRDRVELVIYSMRHRDLYQKELLELRALGGSLGITPKTAEPVRLGHVLRQ